MSTGTQIPSKPAVDEAIKKVLVDAIIDAISINDGILGSLMENVVPNGSLESFQAEAVTPDNWTRTLLQNGAGAKEQSNSWHGGTAYKFTRTSGASNGGGYLETSAFIPIGSLFLCSLKCSYFASAAIKSTVEIRWYDKDQVYISTTTAATIQQATKYRTLFWSGYAPNTARYAKLRLTGGTIDVDVAGYALFDAITFTAAPLDLELDGQEYTHTGDTAYATVASFPVAIPSDATYLNVTVDLKLVNGGSGGTPYYKATLNATDGTELSGSTSYAAKTSQVTIAASDKGEVRTCYIKIKTTVDTSTAYARLTSDISNGFEAKVTIT